MSLIKNTLRVWLHKFLNGSETADRLVDYEILELCQQGGVIGYDPDLINPASLDIRVGPSGKVEVPGQSELAHVNLANYTAENPYLLPPKAFMLLDSYEVFWLPENIEGTFLLKSSRAREGLNHLLAGYCDPGWHNSRLTMEVVNERQYTSLPIYPGLKIGQIRFNRVKYPERSYRYTGRYNHDLTVASSKG